MYRNCYASDHQPKRGTRRLHTAVGIKLHVMQTSCALLRVVGPRAFTVVDVAKRSRVARTTIYKYFGTKAGLLAACREYSARTESRNIQRSPLIAHERAIRTPKPGKGQLPRVLQTVRQMMLALVDQLQDQSDLFLLTGAEAIRSIRRPHGSLPEYELLPAGIPRQFFHGVAELLARSSAAGELKAGLNPQQITQLLQAFWWQELCLRGPIQDQAPPERERLAANLDLLLKLVAAA